jgi:hypothetical protein
MSGSERARFCGLCKKHVYNISAMSRTDAEALIREKEGRDVCIRLYKRADGTVIVDNCPVGLRAIRKRVRWIIEGVAAAVALFGAVIVTHASRSSGAPAVTLKEWFFPPKPAIPAHVVPPVKTPVCFMGKMAIRPTPPVPSAPVVNGSSAGSVSNED